MQHLFSYFQAQDGPEGTGKQPKLENEDLCFKEEPDDDFPPRTKKKSEKPEKVSEKLKILDSFHERVKLSEESQSTLDQMFLPV